MSDTIKDLNPRFNGRKGRPRNRACIVGGLFIECKEGRRWYKDKYNYELAANHSEDMSVMMALWDELEKHGVTDARRVALLVPCTADCHPEHTSGHNAWDFLVITYVERGPFRHDGIGDCEFVVDEERRPHPGVKEEKVRDQLKELFGIESTGYKSHYDSDMYYSWLVRD